MDEARLIVSYPWSGGGMFGWFAALRNESGRPWNPIDLEGVVYAICM